MNFNFISFGFSHGYSVARNVFLDYLTAIVSLKSGVVVLGLICPNSVSLVVGDKSIWCFYYLPLLAETAATGGKVNQRAAKRTRGFPLAAGEK